MLYPNAGANMWDVGPGTVMIKALGGFVAGVNGTDYTYGRQEDQTITYGIVAINTHQFADELIHKFKEVLVEIGQADGKITGL